MVFLFIDDSLQYHERFGQWLADHFDYSFFARVLHCGTEKIGELISLAPYILGFLPALFVVYIRSNKELRRMLIITMSFIAGVFSFGVVLNFVEDLNFFEPIAIWLDIMENFGTMIFMSALVSYIASKSKRTGQQFTH